MKARITKHGQHLNGWYIYLENCDDWLNDNPNFEKEFSVYLSDGIIYIEKPFLNFSGTLRKLSKKGRFYLTSDELEEGIYTIIEINSETLEIDL